MNGAGTRGRDFGDSSHVRTPAQSRADLESPRARVPHTAGRRISPTTGTHPLALQSKSNSFLPAYGAEQLPVQCFAERLQLRASYPSRRYTRGYYPTSVRLPPPRSQTLRWHRTVLPDIMYDRTPANSNRTSLMLSCLSHLSGQALATLAFRRTGAPFYPLLSQIRRQKLPSSREYMYNRHSHQSEAQLTTPRLASNSNRLPSTTRHGFGLAASMSTKHISITP